MAHALHSNPDCFVLFSGGEESLYQTKMVCERLFHKREPNFYVGEERLLDSQAKDLHPKYVQLAARGQQRSVLGHMRTLMRKHPNKQPILLMDALQSFDDGKYADGYTNSQTPFRVLKAVNDFCKSTFASAIVVGQVTKSGDPLGANKIIHEIDTLLHLFFDVREKSVTHGMRIIQTRKNRYGCAQQAHVVIMESDGLREDGAIYED
jgi:predicted ATP-dependent serine protease